MGMNRETCLYFSFIRKEQLWHTQEVPGLHLALTFHGYFRSVVDYQKNVEVVSFLKVFTEIGTEEPVSYISIYRLFPKQFCYKMVLLSTIFTELIL
jgi:hypothetical protein